MSYSFTQSMGSLEVKKFLSRMELGQAVLSELILLHTAEIYGLIDVCIWQPVLDCFVLGRGDMSKSVDAVILFMTGNGKKTVLKWGGKVLAYICR